MSGDNSPAPAPTPTDPNALPDETVRRVIDLLNVGREFCGVLRSLPALAGPKYVHTTEQILAAQALNFSDALRALSPEEVDPLPANARVGVRRLRTAFEDLVVERWGWGHLVGEGDDYIAKRVEWFDETVRKPLYAAALALAEDPSSRGELADKACDLLATLFPEEVDDLRLIPADGAEATFKGLLGRFEREPIFGDIAPSWGDGDIEVLGRAINLIHAGIREQIVILECQEAILKEAVAGRLPLMVPDPNPAEMKPQVGRTEERTVDEQVDTVPSVPYIELLEAAYDLNAFNKNTCKNKFNIVKQSKLDISPRGGCTHQKFITLVRAGYFESHKSCIGGYSLTPKGRLTVERKRQGQG